MQSRLRLIGLALCVVLVGCGDDSGVSPTGDVPDASDGLVAMDAGVGTGGTGSVPVGVGAGSGGAGGMSAGTGGVGAASGTGGTAGSSPVIPMDTCPDVQPADGSMCMGRRLRCVFGLIECRCGRRGWSCDAAPDDDAGALDQDAGGL